MEIILIMDCKENDQNETRNYEIMLKCVSLIMKISCLEKKISISIERFLQFDERSKNISNMSNTYMKCV